MELQVSALQVARFFGLITCNLSTWNLQLRPRAARPCAARSPPRLPELCATGRSRRSTVRMRGSARQWLAARTRAVTRTNTLRNATAMARVGTPACERRDPHFATGMVRTAPSPGQWP